MTPASVKATGLGVRFLFDTQGNVVTPVRAKWSLRTSESWGVRDVNVSIEPGEGVALIGPTGSGKTTLLRTIAGVLPADEGQLLRQGRVASMLSIDAGLLQALTGRENALLLAVLGGAGRAEAKAQLGAIKERSGLEDSFDHPASTYSQGMRARLGFTAATACDPDLILLDEVHEALDHRFREALEETVRAVLARGGIAVAAGHDHEILSRFCSRALLLDGGGIVADGPFEQVRSSYLEADLRSTSLDESIGLARPAPGASR
jgi:ABC-type polysaccharide/polyol phosphate transport system ATPase subunit